MSSGKVGKLFRPEGWIADNVHLDWLEDYTPYAMAEAFKISADRVIDSLEDDHGHPDKYFYPAAYLYRHSLELLLKYIADFGAQALPQLGGAPLLGHDLNALWVKAKGVIDFVFTVNAEPTDLMLVTEAIAEFAQIDPDGQSLRYFRDRKGNKNLSQAPRVLSLPVLRREMNKVFLILDGCVMSISAFIDSVRETERY